jgi:pyruvate dehydrogenase E2 component (dihydrolipoamide acetyltransferase)
VTELKMPKLTDSMEQGTILTWLKRNGEQVQEGEDLVEIETDKATATHAAEAAGILEIVADEGTTLPVGAPIARLDVAGESSPSARAIEANGAQRTNVAAWVTGPGNDLLPVTNKGVRATPLARREAGVHGVRLEEVVGSGPLGRVTRKDVRVKAGVATERAPVEAPSARDATTAPEPEQASAVTGKGTGEAVEPTRTQSLIARRMAEAKATIPHFQVQAEVTMDAVVAFREELKSAGVNTPSFNDFIVKAAALVLREHPLANGSYRDGHFEFHSRINVGIAVAADHALVVPTIFDADRKSVGSIAAESRRLAERVRTGEIEPAELSGATFTVSNLGMYGMTAITPVINPPQAAILGVGAIRDILARVDGRIVDKRLMTLTLSCDHRILYGAEAAQFLSSICELLEQPLRLAFEPS